MANDGGPAFPVEGAPGMSLRDYFAAQAMHFAADIACDLLSDGHGLTPEKHAEQHAKAAYMLADAMLKAREVA